MRYVSLVATVLLLALLSCGGKSAKPITSATAVPLVPLASDKSAQLPALPAAGHFAPQRLTSSAQVVRTGDQADSSAHGTAAAGSLTLTAAASQAAFGLYHFEGVPGENITQLDFSGSGLSAGGQVWIGLSDYTAKSWKFFAPQTSASGSLPVTGSPGQFTSSGGDIYVVVIVFGAASYTLDSIGVAYPQRFSVSGTVVDDLGGPMPGVTVSSPLYNLTTTTDGNGAFTLAGLPDGTWPLMATKDGWTFYDNPTVATITGADASGVSFTGHLFGSNFLPHDPGPEDNTATTARQVDFSNGPVSGSLSVVDDPLDFLQFTVNTPGTYYIEFRNPAMDIYYPYLSLTTTFGNPLASSYFAVEGTVRIPLVVANAPQDFRLRIVGGGGGGHYTVGLGSGPLTVLEGHLTIAGVGIDHCLVAVADTVTGDTTVYNSSALSGGSGQYADLYRAPHSSSVSFSAQNYTFTPSTLVVDLSAGPVLDADATAAYTPQADHFEPNSTKLDCDANANLVLPFQTLGGPLTISGLYDPTDMYKVTPAAGNGLAVEVQMTASDGGTMPLTVNLLDHDATTLLSTAPLFTSAQTAEIMLPAPADGNPYYIQVLPPSGSQRTFLYVLSAFEYTGAPVHTEVYLGAKPVANAQVQLRIGDLSGTWTTYTNGLGRTPDLLLLSGAHVAAELLRFGLNTNRNTQEVVTTGAAQTITFTADPAQSADSLEPNDGAGNGVDVNLPLSIHASLAGTSGVDASDNYRINIADSNPLQVELTNSTASKIGVTLDDDMGNFVTGVVTAPGLSKVYLATNGPGHYQLLVATPGIDTTYTLKANTTPLAYHLKGSVTASGAGVAYAPVHCAELGLTRYCAAGTGAYDFGLVAPGSYTLETKVGGYTTDQGAPVATVTNADVNVDFTLTAAPVDALEPNDSAATAVSLPTDGSVSPQLSVGDSDLADYYKVNLTAGQRCGVKLAWGAPWYPDVFVAAYDPGMNNLANGDNNGSGDQNFAFIAPSTGTYLLNIYSGTVPVEYTITVTAQ